MKILLFITLLGLLVLFYIHFIKEDKEKNNYVKLKNTNSLESKLCEKTLVVILAPWCGYCKKLKESGVLNNLSKHIKVIEITDTHPQSNDIMKSASSEGFPTIILYRDNQFFKYSGDRSEHSLMKFIV